MTGTITLDGELELEETTDAGGNKVWQVVDAGGNPRKLLLGEVDADVGHVGELLVTSDSGNEVTEVVAVIEDTDSSTPLELDTGTLSEAHERYEIDISVSNKTGGTNTEARMQLNGVSATSYEQVELDGATLNQRTGLSYLTLILVYRYNWAAYHATVKPETSPAVDPSANTRRFPVWGNGSLIEDGPIMQNGEIKDAGSPDVTQIRVFTPDAAIGRMVIKGVRIE